ncbi:hypothetical protein OG21DRAFT_1488594 [Imleria badia]|nr:hypothetical protein OG21DRAFT_1488594 [Imleria badia]
MSVCRRSLAFQTMTTYSHASTTPGCSTRITASLSSLRAPFPPLLLPSPPPLAAPATQPVSSPSSCLTPLSHIYGLRPGLTPSTVSGLE